ncbi:MAG: nitrous oxide-stimulated promoter family protein [Bacilli bacterium]
MKNKFYQWEKEKKLIPVMIRKYCNGKHKTKRKEICNDCLELTEYALFRLGKCPFKSDKKFCSFCKIHCYDKEMRKRIKEVMKYSGPRMLFSHPIFAISHLVQMIQYKREGKKEKKNV